ncbi:myelin basic protein-like [Sinocyclocheilus grahami]|uniref:myelin basic protein-like n=1 Tax=Sinocyclocheilus grahami TaxID=75366 RepID=UPI0007AD5542|nr:PREDICTED: myelin basic protein-like [Sinocyclocheilus grahami]
MATASTSGQSPFGLGRKKRAPGLLDQIGRFFGGDKKRKGKGSFRGHLSSSPQRPQHSSTRRRGDVNPVVHFFRSFVSSPRPKSRVSLTSHFSTGMYLIPLFKMVVVYAFLVISRKFAVKICSKKCFA